MQTGSKPGCYNPLHLGITPSSVFRYIGIHIPFAHQNFANLSHVQLFTLTFRTKPLGFHELLLLVLSFRLIPSLGTFLNLEHLSNIFFVLGNCLKKTSSQVQQLLVSCHDQCALLDFTFLTCEMHH